MKGRNLCTFNFINLHKSIKIFVVKQLNVKRGSLVLLSVFLEENVVLDPVYYSHLLDLRAFPLFYQ